MFSGVHRRAALLALFAVLCVGMGLVGNFARADTVAQTGSGSMPGHLAAIADSDDYGQSGVTSIVEADGDGRHRRSLVANVGAAGYPAFSPDGRQLALVTARKGLIVVDATSGRVRQLVGVHKGVGVYGVSWSRDGRWVLYAANGAPGGIPHKRYAIFRISPLGASPRRLTPYENAVQPSGAPGGRVVYVTLSPGDLTGASQVCSVSERGGDPRRLFTEPFGVLLPHVSPDGRQIVFMRAFENDLASAAIELVGVHGGPVSELTPRRKDLYNANPSWSPDGRRIAFLSSRRGRVENKPSNQLLDAYTMTRHGTDVRAAIAFRGSRTGLDDLTWGR